MKIRPLQNNILVKPLYGDDKTKGGIIIPDSAKERPMKGEVIAAGKGKMSETGKVVPLDIKVGNKVLYSRYAGNEVKVEDENYLIMREEDVYAIIEE